MDKIRIVVAGIGGRGEWIVSELCQNENFRLAGLVDKVPERVRLLIKERGLPEFPIYQNIDECLAKLDFDALVVSTPDNTHAELTVPALRAGKYVYVEKPLDITHSGLDAIIQADKSAGGKTFVGFNLRYAPVYVKVRELIDSGILGRVLTIQADEFYDGGRTYFRRWNRLCEFGGGLWITKACHDFDSLYWMAKANPELICASSSLDYYVPRDDVPMYCGECHLGESCPDRYSRYVKPGSFYSKLFDVLTEINGHRPDLCLYNSNKDTFDHGVATVTFINNIIATYTVNVVTGVTNRRMRVSGTEATVDSDLEESKVTIYHKDPLSKEEIYLGGSVSGHGGADEHIFNAFASFVRGEQCSYVDPVEAAVAVRMGLAARDSTERGEAIRMSL